MSLNPFAVFDITVDFQIDQNLLSERYLTLQKALHPDNFAGHSPQEQRLAMQKSAEVNDALQILKDPIRRADAMIALGTGENENIEEKSTRDLAFLMQQMEWRERLEEIESARDDQALTDFTKEIEQINREILQRLSDALADQQWAEASAQNDKLRFVRKLFVEIERIEDQFADF